MITNLDEVREGFLAGRTGEAAVYCVLFHVLFEHFQPIKDFGAQETGVGSLFRVQHHVVVQRRVADEALVAIVAGEGEGVPAVDPQVLVQLVFVPEGLATVCAFKGTETLPDEKVLQRCILGGKREKNYYQTTATLFTDTEVGRG